MMGKRLEILRLFVVGMCVLFASALSAYAAPDLNSQIDKMVEQLTASIKGEVVKGTETEVYLGLGQEHGVVQGNKFEIVRQGEPLKIDDEIVGYEETKIAQVVVDRAREKISICAISEKSGTPQVGDKAYQLRKQVKRLVVGQFSYNQSFNQLTKSLQEKLVTSMANSGMQVVERDQLERVLKEQKLGYSGLINMDSAKKIGELLGADGMLLGTINDMGNEISLIGRLVDIESGNAISAAEVDLPKTPLIAQLLEVPVADKPFTPSPDGFSSSEKNNNKSAIKPSVDIDVFTCTLQFCKKSGSNVNCEVLMVNNDNDKNVTLDSSGTRLIDNHGNAYGSGKVFVANETGGAASATLVKGIPLRAGALFQEVPPQTESAALVELHFRGLPKVQFRNILFE